MAYAKTNWTNTTPINTTNLNNIENGISANDTAITTINTNIGNLSNLTTPDKSSLVGAINSIVESGSNDNGKWTKFADGTIIQWGKYTIQVSEITWTALTTGLFYSNSFSHKLPVKILENSSANNVSSRSANFDWAVRNATANDGTGTFLSFNLVSATNAARNININWFVVSRWK